MTERPAPIIRIDIPYAEVADFCVRHHIRKLALFGSVLRDDFDDDSDVDVLVEFDANTPVGFFELARMSRELTQLLGRQVDVLTPGFLSRHFRQDVLNSTEIIYEKAS
jgi:predicted nucleotidyltransferase